MDKPLEIYIGPKVSFIRRLHCILLAGANITNILLAGVLVASSQMGIFYSLLIKTMRSFECKLKAGLIPVSVGTLWSRQVDDGGVLINKASTLTKSI